MVRRQSSADEKAIIKAWSELAEQGVKDIEAEGISAEKIKVVYVADMRYLGEGHEVQVNVPDDHEKSDMVKFAWQEFHKVHDDTFGFQYEGEQDVEIVNLRVQAIGQQYRPEIRIDKGPQIPAEPTDTRFTYWDDWVDSPIYQRSALKSGQLINGPAIIEEYGSTIVIPINWTALRDDYGNLVMRKEIQSESK
tara:strand:+ start:86 stop:664 length:579 start_codon:yes stop_codon:yes gene_type:complete